LASVAAETGCFVASVHAAIAQPQVSNLLQRSSSGPGAARALGVALALAVTLALALTLGDVSREHLHPGAHASDAASRKPMAIASGDAFMSRESSHAVRCRDVTRRCNTRQFRYKRCSILCRHHTVDRVSKSVLRDCAFPPRTRRCASRSRSIVMKRIASLSSLACTLALAACGGSPHDDASPGVASSDAGDRVRAVVAGGLHTCALSTTDRVRCWGDGSMGQLGYAAATPVMSPAAASDVDVGGDVVQIAAGDVHTCALLASGDVRCWGAGSLGRLGYGNTRSIGAADTPASIGVVDIGGRVVEIAAGSRHTCAVIDGGAVRCWGEGSFGRLGYGDPVNVGDAPERVPSKMGDVDVGGAVTQVVAGGDFTCALLVRGAVRCWGYGGGGALGYANNASIGATPDTTPARAGDVDVGGVAVAITAGDAHVCALLDDGGVVCWGLGTNGRLGHGNEETIGADDRPLSAGRVDVGDNVAAIAAGGFHTCAKLESGAVRCWGAGDSGQLGYGNHDNVGDLPSSLPSVAGNVAVGAAVQSIAAGTSHTCAIVEGARVKCWGLGSGGQLGLGDRENIGDERTPAAVGYVAVF
jgi:alpha-tubulin suppressor-like RCC1 family protein